MHSNTQATPVAIDPDHLSSLFIVDAVLRRLSECLSLQANPMPDYAAPAIPRAVLHLIVEDLSDRMANYTHALLASQEVQP